MVTSSAAANCPIRRDPAFGIAGMGRHPVDMADMARPDAVQPILAGRHMHRDPLSRKTAGDLQESLHRISPVPAQPRPGRRTERAICGLPHGERADGASGLSQALPGAIGAKGPAPARQGSSRKIRRLGPAQAEQRRPRPVIGQPGKREIPQIVQDTSPDAARVNAAKSARPDCLKRELNHKMTDARPGLRHRRFSFLQGSCAISLRFARALTAKHCRPAARR